jgi:peptidoglycan/LPS O-acetylase OafA/YrhL
MQSQQRVHFNGFDWLRAFMPWLVVMWHMNTFGISQLYSTKLADYKINAPDVLVFQTIVLTVPVFVLMSSYLMARFPSDWRKTAQRVLRLASLALFWTFMLTIWKGGFDQIKRLVPHSLFELIIKVMSANGEFYYFFMVLIFCTLLTFLLVRLPTIWNVIGLAASLLLTFFLPPITIASGKTLLLAYWNPLSFLCYPFLGVTLVRYQDQLFSDWKKWALAIVACLVVGQAALWYEWTHYVNVAFFPGNELSFPLLARVSLVLDAAAIVIAAMWAWSTAPAIVRAMSKLSLGMFVLHAFLRPIVIQNLPATEFPSPQIARYVQTALVIMFCYVLAWIAPYFLKDDLVR